MGEDNFAMGYALGQDSSSGGNGGMFGGDGWLGLILFAMIFGNGGWGGGFGGGGGASSALTRAELYDGFAIQNIDSAVRNVQNGIADSTYALNNSLVSGFHGVDSALCSLGHQMSDCCRQTQRSIDGVRYDMATQACDTRRAVSDAARDITDNANANTRTIMDFLVNEKLTSKDARIAELQNQLSQSNQNAVIRAAIDASTAEIIRRTGNDCPTPAYWVSPPTPVTPPCGGFANYGNGCGCGCN